MEHYSTNNMQTYGQVRENNNSRNSGTFISSNDILHSPYQYRTLIMNSRERDRTTWDNAYTFQIKLDEPIRFVRSIKLVDFICNLERRYLINSFNNTYEISIDAGANWSTRTLSIGDYDLVYYGNSPTSLVTSFITDVVAGAGAGTVGSNHLNNITEKITWTNDSGEDILLRFNTTSSNKDSLAYILGFKPNTEYSFVNNSIVTGEYRINYIKSSVAIININNNEFDVIKSNLSNKTNQTYGIINIDKDYNKYKAGTPIIKTFYNPLNFLDKLKIEITDIYGNGFDFQDSDLILAFLIEYENQRN